MAENARKWNENTVPTLSGHDVLIERIWERDLPGDNGEVRSQLSAVLVIFDPGTNRKSYRETTVTSGSVVTLGSDRYCITALKEGKTMPGAIWMRKLGD